MQDSLVNKFIFMLLILKACFLPFVSVSVGLIVFSVLMVFVTGSAGGINS